MSDLKKSSETDGQTLPRTNFSHKGVFKRWLKFVKPVLLVEA